MMHIWNEVGHRPNYVPKLLPSYLNNYSCTYLLTYVPKNTIYITFTTYTSFTIYTDNIYNTYTTYITYVLAFPWRYTPSPLESHHFTQAAKRFYFWTQQRVSSLLQNIQTINVVHLDKTDLTFIIHLRWSLATSSKLQKVLFVDPAEGFFPFTEYTVT